MKRINPLIIIAIIAISSALFFLLKPYVKEANREPINDMIVLYVDGRQLIDKSGIEEYFGEENRKFIATIATGALDSDDYNEHIVSIAANPDESGLWLSRPVYIYVNFDDNNEAYGAAIVEVNDINKLDTTMKLLGDIIAIDGGYFDFKIVGDTRYFTLEGLAGGYNKSHLALTIEDNDASNVLHAALERPLADLSLFEEHDAALYLDINKFVDNNEKQTAERIAKLRESLANSEYDFEVELFESQIAQLEEQMLYIGDLRSSLRSDAAIISTLDFNAGRIRFTTDFQGVIFSEGLMQEATNEHLAYIDEEVVAIANYGINGKLIAQLISDNIPSNMATMLGVGRNEFGVILQIGMDALSSMNGDFTVALNDLTGGIHERYNAYRNRRYEQLEVDGVKAMLMTDVTDSYIIDNITRFGGRMFSRTEDGALTMSLGNNIKLYVGQEEDMFYAGINSQPLLSPNPATSAVWYNDVRGSVGYSVLNINSLLYCSYVDAAYNEWLSTLSSADAELARSVVSSLDYLYHRLDKRCANELVLVFKDRETNALKQIVDQFAPYLILDVDDLF